MEIVAKEERYDAKGLVAGRNGNVELEDVVAVLRFGRGESTKVGDGIKLASGIPYPSGEPTFHD